MRRYLEVQLERQSAYRVHHLGRDFRYVPYQETKQGAMLCIDALMIKR